jgi:PKD repeat protein
MVHHDEVLRASTCDFRRQSFSFDIQKFDRHAPAIRNEITGSNGSSVTFTPDDNGDYRVVLTASDEDGGSSSTEKTISVGNLAPTVGVIIAPMDPTAVNNSFTASANFTDPGTADTHTIRWDWGDGKFDTYTASGSNLTGSHAYTSAGVYTVQLTVNDDEGSSSASIFQYIVVYDPSAGFVTGGGWINSPAGAYVANPELTGKATFGFVSKYQNGNNVPTGNTEFQFKVADFIFKSTSYEWLVVSGAKGRFRGVGTVNGAGSYGFELTVWDGQAPGGGGVDRFRIKIWNQNQGNGVVYDNMLGAADGADPTTALGGGSIVIHKNS